MPGQGSDLFLSPNEQNLLVAALNSNQTSNGAGNNQKRGSPTNISSNPASGQLDYSDESPYLDFDPDGEFDDSYAYGNSRMIGDLPDLHDKRKSIDGDEDKDDEGDRKRHEGDEKGPKKPGRKPLTSEPTTVSTKRVLIEPALIMLRNVKLKIVQHSAPFVSARSSI